MFPRTELNIGGKSYAIFATESGYLDIVKMNAKNGRNFACKYGYFEPNDKYRYICGNSDIYFFDQNSATPMNIKALIDIQSHLAKTPGKARLSLEEVKEIATDKHQVLAQAIGAHAIRFLDDYYAEDVVARHDLIMEAQHKDRFKLKQSHSIIPFIPQPTLGKKNIAIVVINDTMIDIVVIDPKVDAQKKVRYFEDQKYGKFIIREPKTRYRYGKTNVYVVAVSTSAAPVEVHDMVEVPEIEAGGKVDDKPKKSAADEKYERILDLLEKKIEEPTNGKTKIKQKGEKKKLFEKSKPEPTEFYEPVRIHTKVGPDKYALEAQTITINANVFLPHVKFEDPILLRNTFTQVKQAKVAIDLVSKPAKKNFLIDPKLLLAAGIMFIFVVIGVIILEQQDLLNFEGFEIGGGPFAGFGSSPPPPPPPPPSEDITPNLTPPAESPPPFPIPQLPEVKLPGFSPP